MADYGDADLPPEFMTTSERAAKSERGQGAWQTVPSRAKPRKPEKEGSKSGGLSGGKGVAGDGSSVFASLEDEAKQRRARIEAKRAEDEGADDVDEDEDEDLEFEGYGENAKAGAAAAAAAAGEKKEKKPKKPRVTVGDAAAKINPEELAAFLVQINDSFGTLPDVPLMRCADFFARAFSTVTPGINLPKIMRDSSMAKALEVPLADVPEPVINTAATWLQDKPPEELGRFLTLLLSVAVEDLVPPGKSTRGLPQLLAPPKAKVGMLVVLAILLRKKPEVMLQQAESIRNNPTFHTQERLPVLAWAYGQVAQADLPLGMWLWSRNLLPLATGKNSSPLTRDVILTFLETVLLKNLKKARSTLINGAVRKGERLVPPAALDLYMRLSFPMPEARTKATERFEAQYQTVKDVALAGASRGKTTKPAAAQLFPLALKAIAQDSTRAEGCSVAIWCLGENSECYKQWEKHHLEELDSSTQLLGHVVRSWREVGGRLQPLADVRAFSRDLRLKHKVAMAEAGSDAGRAKQLAKAEALRQQLEGKLSWVPACTRATATLVAVGAMAYGFYLMSPTKNPWGWDGYLLLSKTHGPLRYLHSK